MKGKSFTDSSIGLGSRREPAVAPANRAAGPDVSLHFGDIASVALDVCSNSLNFGDLLGYLLPNAF